MPHVENVIYWSHEESGRRTVITIEHVTIYTRYRPSSTEVFISSKQLYASHYFETAFGVIAFVDAVGEEPPPNAYLISMNCSRFDTLRGVLKGMIISLAKNRIYNAVKHSLCQTKT